MTTLRLALIQMRSEVASRDHNVSKALGYMDEVAKEQPDLIVVPEFFNTEYFAQYRDYKYMDYAEPEDGYTITAMRKKAAELRVHICATIFEQEGPGLYYDTAFMIDPSGEVIGKYRKTHPAAVLSLEKIYFRGGVRFPVWEINGIRVSAIICYDHFFPETARCAAINGAEVILGPFAAPPDTTENWDAMMRIRAFENGVFMAPCNKVGVEGGWTFGGGSLVADPYGKIVQKASTQEDDTVIVDIDRETIFEARRAYPLLRDRRPEIYGPITSSDEVARRLVG
jgi:N-carbamoylputrescine amidase